MGKDVQRHGKVRRDGEKGREVGEAGGREVTRRGMERQGPQRQGRGHEEGDRT